MTETLLDNERAPKDFGVSQGSFSANVLGAFARALSDRMEEAVEKATKLGKSACYVIVVVGSEPGSSIETLRRMLNLDHSSLVRALQKHEAAGYIVRERSDPNDSRVVRIRLSKKGLEVFEQIVSARRQVLEKAMENLSEDEMAGLQALVTKIMPSIVKPGDDQHFVCRLCDLEVCPQEICPVNCAFPEHYEHPVVPFRRTA